MDWLYVQLANVWGNGKDKLSFAGRRWVRGGEGVCGRGGVARCKVGGGGAGKGGGVTLALGKTKLTPKCGSMEMTNTQFQA